MQKTLWPDHFVVRPPRLDEAQGVADLIIAGDVAEFGEPDWAVEDTRADWARLGFDPERDARIVVAPDGRLVAYADVFKRPNAVQIGENTTLHPDFEGQGLEEALFEVAESLAAQYAPLPVQWIMEIGRGLSLVERGYTPVRWLWQMRIDFEGPLPAPQWPEGYRVRMMEEADERATQALIERAFTRPDRAAVSFEEWRRFMVEREDFDRTLFFLAVRSDEIVGASLCLYFPAAREGWVRQLAVEERHRGRGLGHALLLHAFREFYGRGARRAALGVDANNPSATRLYRGVGMRAFHEYAQYQRDATGS